MFVLVQDYHVLLHLPLIRQSKFGMFIIQTTQYEVLLAILLPLCHLTFIHQEDLICSCDNVSTIRYWNIKNGGCAGVSKVRATQVRFQPNLGKYLAAADADGVLLIDVETTQICRYPLKGHISIIRGICWSSSGEYLASLSEDMVKVWKIGSSGEQECMHEQSVTGKRFRCCTFHPCYPSVLVVGSDQCLEFWHMAENKMMIVLEEPVNSLAASRPTGVVGSATDNNLIRLWK
uniref:Putative ovule protein n=1 Tax=Solanum chacoense TaxID=4108 RepID=A0A0V0IBV0_SOLCH